MRLRCWSSNPFEPDFATCTAPRRAYATATLNARVTPRGSDELAEVARVFNEMATQLVSRTNDLETSDRLRRQLIADVSHELMTPLTSVLGRLETLAMEDVDLTVPQRRAQAASAMNEARRLERVIGELLASVRLESGGLPLQWEVVAVGRSSRRSRRDTRRSAAREAFV